MNIIIIGAGRVGESVAESLVSERNDITVVDTGPLRLAALQSDFQTWVCTATMLLGRLELFSILVLFTPRFWCK